MKLQALPTDSTPEADRFPLAYLPPPIATRFREALGCHRHGLWRAFAAMCRQTAASVIADVGETGRLRLYDQVAEVQRLGEIDDATFGAVRTVIFDRAELGEANCNRQVAAVLLETMKDLLTQLYVRPAKLRQALKVRKFFAEQAAGDVPITATARDVSGF